MDWTKLPPLSALRAFAAYAQTGSLAQAGAALNVSHAAISQQMRGLETHLGLALVDRSGRQMALTAEGAALASALHDGFDRMLETIEALTGANADRPLHIACTPSFAANWLMPRLAGFRAQHPDINLVIDPNPALTDPKPDGTDVALRFGTGPWPGLENQPLMPAPLVVVGAPQLFPDGPPEHPRDLLSLPWLREIGTSETSQWLLMRGVEELYGAAVTQVPGNLMIDGARQGQGVAVTTRLAVEGDLAAGTLLALFEDDTQGAGYHIVTRPGPLRPPLRAFVTWLRKETAKT